MKLVGPWYSGFTRRVGVTLGLLGIEFQHLDYHAYLQPDLVRQYSPMGRVPALVLKGGETLIDSSSIVDYLDTLVEPRNRLLPPEGADRRRILRIVGFSMACFEKLSRFCDEDLRPDELRIRTIQTGLVEQLEAGVQILENETKSPWFLGAQITHADVMTVVTFQACMEALPGVFSDTTYPALALHSREAMKLPAFSSTCP